MNASDTDSERTQRKDRPLSLREDAFRMDLPPITPTHARQPLSERIKGMKLKDCATQLRGTGATMPLNEAETAGDWQRWLLREAALKTSEARLSLEPRAIETRFERAQLLGELGRTEEAKAGLS